jgi:hypothetical protein
VRAPASPFSSSSPSTASHTEFNNIPGDGDSGCGGPIPGEKSPGSRAAGAPSPSSSRSPPGGMGSHPKLGYTPGDARPHTTFKCAEMTRGTRFLENPEFKSTTSDGTLWGVRNGKQGREQGREQGTGGVPPVPGEGGSRARAPTSSFSSAILGMASHAGFNNIPGDGDSGCGGPIPGEKSPGSRVRAPPSSPHSPHGSMVSRPRLGCTSSDARSPATFTGADVTCGMRFKADSEFKSAKRGTSAGEYRGWGVGG